MNSETLKQISNHLVALSQLFNQLAKSDPVTTEASTEDSQPVISEKKPYSASDLTIDVKDLVTSYKTIDWPSALKELLKPYAVSRVSDIDSEEDRESFIKAAVDYAASQNNG